MLGDIYGMNFDTFSCKVSGYLTLIFLYMLYMTFNNQAFYRLIRIVYFQTLWVEKYWIQILIVLIEFLICCILLSPLINWHGVIYYKNDHFCYASISNILGILWAAAIVYIVPFLILLSIYIFISKYLKKQRANITLMIKLRQNRDFIVIQRIVIIVCLLFILGIPAMSLVVYTIVTGEEHPLTIRITFFAVSVSVSSLTVSLVYTIPQLKTITYKLFQQNRIINTNTARNQNPIGMRNNV